MRCDAKTCWFEVIWNSVWSDQTPWASLSPVPTMIFYRISELMLATLIQRCNKNHFIFYPVQEQETNWNYTGCQVPHSMIVFIPSINLLNLSWIPKCLFLRKMEPLQRFSQICRKTMFQNLRHSMRKHELSTHYMCNMRKKNIYNKVSFA